MKVNQQEKILLVTGFGLSDLSHFFLTKNLFIKAQQLRVNKGNRVVDFSIITYHFSADTGGHNLLIITGFLKVI